MRLSPNFSNNNELESHISLSKVLHAIKPKTMRLNHNIHATSQFKVMASWKPGMIALTAILASLISQELLADGSNIVKAITVSLIGAEVAKNLLGIRECPALWREGQEVDTYIAEALECALGAVRAGLGIEGEGAVAAEVLYIGEAFGVESVKRKLSGW